MTLQDFYDKLNRLRYLIRYSNVPRMVDESVAEHTFFCQAILVHLHEEYDFDLAEALKIMLVHDFPEYAVNDTSYETKQLFPEVAKYLLKAEYESIKHFPEMVRVKFDEYQKGETVPAMFCKLADSMQCEQYADNEITLGNKGYMLKVKESSEARIKWYLNKVEPYKRTK